MKVAIIGSRDFTDYKYMLDCILKTVVVSEIDCIVSGGARGADTLAEFFAMSCNIPTMIFKADWNKFGKAAGFIRNTQIVENSDIVLAFPIGESKGTYDSIAKAKKLNKQVFIFRKEISDAWKDC